ncbi:MAG: hypothetical protein DI587_31275 [Variovorax paradoxus]|nr:MAG: hypothetical protein DI583_31275 [Variovorax paradoxus]PZQ03143.1 MAG: hypothetical protein DI587_31275 [Variovorax paradoxus]
MHDRIEIAPGVFRRVQQRRAVYSGDGEDLVAAGLVTLSMLPGQPGNPRGMSTFHHDGTRIRQGDSTRPEPGHMRIVRVKGKGGTFYEVWLLLSAQRLEAIEAERLHMQSWPFPLLGGTMPSLASAASGTQARLARGVSAMETRRAPGVPAAMLRASNGGAAGIGRRAATAGAAA